VIETDVALFPGYQLDKGVRDERGVIRTGELVNSRHRVPIRDFVPRFRLDEGYAANFGDQWKVFSRTQLDSVNGSSISRDRFLRGTGWPAHMPGESILEVGCGAGRFTEVMLATGARVVSVDYSSAVDACWKNNGPHPRLTVVQADVFDLPFAPASFDRVFCYGVIQHTPDPRGAFLQLARFVRPGGHIAVDAYTRETRASRWTSKYLWRPITTRMPPRVLRRIVAAYVPAWLPIDNALKDLPVLSRVVTIIPCWNYTGMLPLTATQIREWAILDTFDALGARYDYPQTLESVRGWFRDAGMPDADVRLAGNGIEANGIRPV
jgi:SAM-dependent methyltransferase